MFPAEKDPTGGIIDCTLPTRSSLRPPLDFPKMMRSNSSRDADFTVLLDPSTWEESELRRWLKSVRLLVHYLPSSIPSRISI